MRMVNSSNQVLVTDEFGGLEVPPGGECDIPDGYCDPCAALNGDRVPSLVERLAKPLVPVDPKLKAVWGRHPRISKPPKNQDTARLRGMPPAVAVLVEDGTVDAPRKGKRE